MNIFIVMEHVVTLERQLGAMFELCDAGVALGLERQPFVISPALA